MLKKFIFTLFISFLLVFESTAKDTFLSLKNDKVNVTQNVNVIWFPKVCFACLIFFSPNALEIIDPPPIPIAIPIAAMKKETGKTLGKRLTSGKSKRRVSFACRFAGMKGPMKKPNGKPTRKAKALEKWGFGSVGAARSFCNNNKEK